MEVKRFKRLPIMGILRGIDSGILEPLLKTVESSGLETIEITMNTKGAARLIRRARALSKKLVIGAGTVLNLENLKSALDSGATFIVTPVLIREIMEYCVRNKMPVFPGALSPTDIYNAWRAGATMVKVFPAGVFGPEYLKEIKGPFDNIELLACGGVTPLNLKSYFSCGASAVTLGKSVFKEEWLKERDFKSIGGAIKNFLDEFIRIKGGVRNG